MVRIILSSRAVFVSDGNTDELSCGFQRQKQKVFRLNGKEYQRMSDHVGKYPVVMLSPADSTLITGGSDERRRFMNMIISQYDPVYLDALMRYNKALMQRNRILREGGRDSSSMLEIYDEMMEPEAEVIHRSRKALTDDLVPLFASYYAKISGGAERVGMRYRSHVSEGDFRQQLADAREKDQSMQFTTLGIHRDDLLFEIDGYSARTTASQGQQKSFIVALKLAKYGLISKMNGFAPALLLDDIFDKIRQQQGGGDHKTGQLGRVWTGIHYRHPAGPNTPYTGYHRRRFQTLPHRPGRNRGGDHQRNQTG